MAKEVLDGFMALTAGMDSGHNSLVLSETAYSRGINVVVRDGFVTTRPGFTRLLNLSGTVFQGAGRWSLDASDRLVVVIDGHIYVVNMDTAQGTDLGLLVDPTATCALIQTDRWFLVQDGITRPVVIQEISGAVSVYGRDPPNVCLVLGTVGAYAHGRIHYVPTYVPEMVSTIVPGIPDSSTERGNAVFVSSDIRDILNPEYMFRMTEHIDVDLGGGLQLPQEMGIITGFGLLRGAATGTGAGSLVVFGREGVSTFAIDIPRDQWITTPIAQALFMSGGTRSPWSIIDINGDLIFVDVEGHIRSLGYTEYERQKQLTNRAQSFALTHFVDTVQLATRSLAHADNRILATMGGIGGYFRALACMDLASNMTTDGGGSAVYDGVWTGFKVMQVLALRIAAKARHVAIVKRTVSGFAMIAVDYDALRDTGTAETAIESQLMTRTMVFGAPVDVKILKYVELRLADISENITLNLYYRPSGYPYWESLGSKTIVVPAGSAHQTRRRVRFSVDYTTAGCDSTVGEKLYVGEGFQFLLTWTGHMAIERFRAVAGLNLDAPPECADDNTSLVILAGGTVENDYSYEVTL